MYDATVKMMIQSNGLEVLCGLMIKPEYLDRFNAIWQGASSGYMRMMDDWIDPDAIKDPYEDYYMNSKTLMSLSCSIIRALPDVSFVFQITALTNAGTECFGCKYEDYILRFRSCYHDPDEFPSWIDCECGAGWDVFVPIDMDNLFDADLVTEIVDECECGAVYNLGKFCIDEDIYYYRNGRFEADAGNDSYSAFDPNEL